MDYIGVTPISRRHIAKKPLILEFQINQSVMIARNYSSTMTLVIALWLITMSCDENAGLPASGKSASPSATANPNVRITNYSFDGKEGDPIPLDVANKWITNYSSINAGAQPAHFFGKNTLEKILSGSSCIGIRFYYSIDDSDTPSLLANGVDASGNDLSPAFGIRGKNSSVSLNVEPASLNMFAGTEGESIALDLSRRWVGNYNSINPGRIQAHFFGYELINQILSQSGCVGIRAYYALNDAGVQQLLLVGVNGRGSNLLPLSSTVGRVSGGGGTIGDASLPCPTYCSGP